MNFDSTLFEIILSGVLVVAMVIGIFLGDKWSR